MYARIINPSVIHSRLKYIDGISEGDTNLFADTTHVGQIQTNSGSVELELPHIYSALYQFFRAERTFQSQFRLIHIDFIETSFQDFGLKLPVNQKLVGEKYQVFD